MVVNRGLDLQFTSVEGRDLDYATLRAAHMDAQVPCTFVESSHPSYILSTSGTTGKPKGVQRDTGGHTVALVASMSISTTPAPVKRTSRLPTSDGWSATPISLTAR